MGVEPFNSTKRNRLEEHGLDRADLITSQAREEEIDILS